MKSVFLISLFITSAVLLADTLPAPGSATDNIVNTPVPLWLIPILAALQNVVMSWLQKVVYNMKDGLVKSILTKLVDALTANKEHK